MFGEQRKHPSTDQKSSRSHLTFKPRNVEMKRTNEPERLDASEVQEQTSTRGLTDRRCVRAGSGRSLWMITAARRRRGRNAVENDRKELTRTRGECHSER